MTRSYWWIKTLGARYFRIRLIYSYIRLNLVTHAPQIALKDTRGTY